jgi:hypothetical protein
MHLLPALDRAHKSSILPQVWWPVAGRQKPLGSLSQWLEQVM